MDKQRLEFEQNWNNKLNCNSFTTIRLHNPRKYCIDAVMSVYLKGIWKGDVKVLDVKTISLDQINNYISMLDMGLSPDKGKEVIRTMYKKYPGVNWQTQQIDLILLGYIKDSKEPKLNF